MQHRERERERERADRERAAQRSRGVEATTHCDADDGFEPGEDGSADLQRIHHGDTMGVSSVRRGHGIA
jgi:hypothetical protein